jgi:hypothetical protein
VTTAIRRVAMDLTKMAGDDGGHAGRDMAKSGIELCKEAVPSQNVVEELLMTPRENVTSAKVRAALVEAAKPYRQLVAFYNELVALHAHHTKGTGGASSSTSSAKFRPLKA